MTARKNEEAPETPVQSDELRAKILANSTAGSDTAIGQERARVLNGAEDEEIQERGSTIPIAGGDPKPDFPPHKAAKPVGAQAQPALITTNGTLPVGHVASPSGLVPVSAVTSDPKRGAELIQENLDAAEKHILRSGSDKLSRAKIESMSAGDLRAVASDRGYDIGEYAGARRTRLRFIAAQNKDEGLEGEDSDSSEDHESTSDDPSGN